jgi:amino acid transporter
LKSIDEQGESGTYFGLFMIGQSIIFILAVFIFSPKLASSSFVFTDFNNATGFSSDTIGTLYVCSIGLLTAGFSFAGYESAATMAEETQNPNRAAPMGVMYTISISGSVGFLALLAILYGSQENINYVLNGPCNPTQNLFALVFSGNVIGVGIITGLICLTLFTTGFFNVTVASRIAYSMSRDGAFPYSNYFKELNPTTKSPVRIIILITILNLTLTLLPLVSTTAFTAITQISTSCVLASYIDTHLPPVNLSKE